MVVETVIKTICSTTAIFLLASTFVHPFGPVKRQYSRIELTGDDPRVLPLLQRACQNCHSEQTRWPLYSYLPLVSWAVEKDVAEGRAHLDLSRWDEYSADQKRDLLARIGTEVRNHRMPLARYVLLHPEARLSEPEIQGIYEWTKSQRRALRISGSGQ
jgi:Haem-binding domain